MSPHTHVLSIKTWVLKFFFLKKRPKNVRGFEWERGERNKGIFGEREEKRQKKKE